MTLTLQFSTSSHWASRLIRWATWSKHSHVDIVLPDGRLLGAVTHGGVSVRGYDPSALNIERYTAEVADGVIPLVLTQLGRPYDWAGVIGWGVRRQWQDENSWFCSELIAWACKLAGSPLLNTDDAWRIVPRDLKLSPLLRRQEWA